MARPTKYRKVEFFPEGNYFVPLGKKECELEEVELKVEELEAIRLKDIEGLTQEECAKKMEISRQTFQNIIESGRKKNRNSTHTRQGNQNRRRSLYNKIL